MYIYIFMYTYIYICINPKPYIYMYLLYSTPDPQPLTLLRLALEPPPRNGLRVGSGEGHKTRRCRKAFRLFDSKGHLPRVIYHQIYNVYSDKPPSSEEENIHTVLKIYALKVAHAKARIWPRLAYLLQVRPTATQGHNLPAAAIDVPERPTVEGT